MKQLITFAFILCSFNAIAQDITIPQRTKKQMPSMAEFGAAAGIFVGDQGLSANTRLTITNMLGGYVQAFGNLDAYTGGAGGLLSVGAGLNFTSGTKSYFYGGIYAGYGFLGEKVFLPGGQLGFVAYVSKNVGFGLEAGYRYIIGSLDNTYMYPVLAQVRLALD
ncbi:MAG: hypothetical protein JST82_04905 [Bacteroidetes bacterium]|nr:hypothetical protein [Bacteroidota bacterium]